MGTRSRAFLAALISFSVLAIAAPPATKPAALVGESHQIASVAHADDLLRPRDASSKDGTPIVIYPRQDWKCMTWKFEPAGDDVRLVNYFTHKTLSPKADAAAVVQQPAGKEATDAQRWRFVPVEEGNYRIEHVASGKVLTVTVDGEVIVETWSGAAAQKWKLLAKPEKFSG